MAGIVHSSQLKAKLVLPASMSVRNESIYSVRKIHFLPIFRMNFVIPIC